MESTKNSVPIINLGITRKSLKEKEEIKEL